MQQEFHNDITKNSLTILQLSMQTVQRLLWSFMLPAWKIALSWAKRNTAVIHTRKGTNHRQDEGILLGEWTFIQLKDEKLQTPQIIPPYKVQTHCTFA